MSATNAIGPKMYAPPAYAVGIHASTNRPEEGVVVYGKPLSAESVAAWHRNDAQSYVIGQIEHENKLGATNERNAWVGGLSGLAGIIATVALCILAGSTGFGAIPVGLGVLGLIVLGTASVATTIALPLMYGFRASANYEEAKNQSAAHTRLIEPDLAFVQWEKDVYGTKANDHTHRAERFKIFTGTRVQA